MTAFSIAQTLPRRIAILAGLAAAILAACSNAQSQLTPTWTPAKTESRAPFIIGTNIRIWAADGKRRDPDLDTRMAAIARDGYSSVRFEWGLSAAESIADARDVSASFRAASPLRPLVILTGGGSHRFAGGMPLTKADVTTYRGFASRSALAFGPAIFEIWNEWNLPTQLRPAGEISSYINLAGTTYRALKQADKDAIVLVGAVGNDIGSGPFRADRLKWLDAAISQGLLQNSDGLSIHLYNNCGRYRADPVADMLWRVAHIHEMIVEKTGSSHPLFITEVGWPTRSSPMANCGYSPEESTAQAARFLLAASALPYVRGVWLYEYADRPRAGGLEGHFGLKSTTGNSKAPTCDLSEVMRIIRSSTRRSLEVVGGVYHFSGSDGRNRWDAYWSESGSISQRLPDDARAVQEVCATGREPRGRFGITGNPVLVTR